MGVKPIDLTGGKSVFCFNEAQFHKAKVMAAAEDESGGKIRAMIEQMHGELTRNERATVAFMIIDQLNNTDESAG